MRLFLDKLSSTFTTQLLGFDPTEKNPVVGKIEDSNKLLRQIAVNTGGTGQPFAVPNGAIGGGFGGSFGIGNLLNYALGGYSSRATGTNTGGIGGGTGSNLDIFNSIFDPNNRALGASGGSSGGMTMPGMGNWKPGGTSDQSFFGNIKNLFSTNQGGIFAARNNILTGKTSKLGGIMGGAGDIASFLASTGIFGNGRLSSVIGMAGQGASIGSMFGPWGAAIGAGIGGLIELFTGGKQKKQDQQAQSQLIGDAYSQLQQIKAALDARPPSMSGSQGFSQAQQLQQQYYQAANQIKTKSVRNSALSSGHSQIDPLVSAIQSAGLAADAWSVNRQKVRDLFTGEFAGGNYFGRDNQLKEMLDMRRGLIVGGLPGVDRHFGMFADDEAILNRKHLNRINALAGYDLLAHVGIPNYPNAPRFEVPKVELPKFESGMNFASGISSPSAPNQTSEINVINETKVYIEMPNGEYLEAKIKEVSHKIIKDVVKNKGRV